jgi:putative oxygen-independent coproporphyrinogen III oxidase
VEFGVYVHVPFCARRCDYCAFATWTDRPHLIPAYLDAMVAEVQRARRPAGSPSGGHDRLAGPATSVFFGGGTPSLVDPDGLMAVLTAIPRTADAEVTVECNPDTVTASLLDAYRRGGVNRLSFGVQSMVPHVLAALGRTHDPASVATAVGLARSAGFTNFNLDLIYGGAGESIDDWRHSLEGVLALEPPHISAYALTVEAGTPLADDATRHPDDDDQADKYELADRLLGQAGLAWYEISNWARPDHECRHNRLYWDQGDYLGIGCAAHSHHDGRRWWNVRTPDRYLELMAADLSTASAGEVLDPEVRRLEGLQLALRTADGVPVAALPLDDPDLDGLVRVADGRARLTVAGRLLANEVAVRLR